MSTPSFGADEGPSGTETQLRDLLLDDYYLRKVLRYVLDDGLHECRRVCRTWRTVCGEMPTALCVRSPRELPSAVATFPNATSLYIRNLSGDRGFPLRVDLSCRLVHTITQLRDLKALECSSPDLSRFSEDGFTSFAGLESLELHLTERWRCSEFSSFRFLTNLTTLVVTSLFPAIGSQDVVEPFTDLARIQKLEVPSELLFGEEGQLMFPSLLELIHLSCDVSEGTKNKINDRVFEALSYYASTLRCLKAKFLTWTPLRSSDVALLERFSRLESCSLWAEGDNAWFGTALKKMDKITELSFSYRPFASLNSIELLEAISGMHRLQSLSLDHFVRRIGVESVCLLSQLTRLTKLCCVFPSGAWKRLQFPRLVHLETRLLTPQTGFAHALTSMQRLKALHLTDCELRSIPFDVLARLPELKFLRLGMCRHLLTEDPFPPLGSLTQLTALRVEVALDAALQPSFGHLNRLSGLQSLAIEVRFDGHRTGEEIVNCLVEANFPRLRELEIWGVRWEDAARTALFKRFPVTRRFFCTAAGYPYFGKPF